MRSILRAAVAAAILVTGAGAAAAPTPGPSDPQAIFAAARAAWNFTSYPRYANYRSLESVTVSFEHLQSTSLLPPYGTVGINGGAAKFVTEP